MCLDTFSNRLKEHPNYKKGYGWKVFRIANSGGLHFTNQRWNESYTVPRGKWLDSGKIRGDGIAFAFSNRTYIPHFHIYLDKVSNMDLVGKICVPVRFGSPNTTGIQDGREVVVAKKMFVPKDIKAFLKKHKVI